MRVLIFGDLQIKTKNQTFTAFLDGTREHLNKTISEYNVSLVVNLGDLIDSKNTIAVDDLIYAWNWTKDIEYSIKDHDIPKEGWDSFPVRSCWIIKGNHDISDKDGNIATVTVMESEKTAVFMNPAVVDRESGQFLVIPYTKDQEGLLKWVEGIDRSRIKGIFSHIDWYGCRLTPSFVTDFGLKPAEFLKLFNPGVKIFNGHYHHPQDIGNLHLVGSPLHIDFNDVVGEIERGYTMWDTVTNEVVRIPNPSTYYCLSLELSTEEAIDQASKDLSPNKERLRVRITVPSKLSEEANRAFSGFLWKSVVPSDSMVASLYAGTGLKVCSTPSDVVTKGVESAPDGLNKETLLTIGEEIFNS